MTYKYSQLIENYVINKKMITHRDMEQYRYYVTDRQQSLTTEHQIHLYQ